MLQIYDIDFQEFLIEHTKLLVECGVLDLFWSICNSLLDSVHAVHFAL